MKQVKHKVLYNPSRRSRLRCWIKGWGKHDWHSFDYTPPNRGHWNTELQCQRCGLWIELPSSVTRARVALRKKLKDGTQ